MKITSLLPLVSATLSLAIAIPSEPGFCGPDEAVLFLEDGTSTTIEKDDLASHLDGLTYLNPNATPQVPRLIQSGAPASNITKRGSSAQLIVELSDLDFLGWDIAMSTIVHANQADATVAIASGQMIANSVTTTTSADITVIEDFLSVTTGNSYQDTTTSTLTGTATMTIPKNNWGAIVSNPLTHRKRGYVWTGQPGSGQFSYYQADSFDNASYGYTGGTLSWVKGVMTTCLGDTYPLPRCNGQGTLE
ncbi:hypothetical protein BO71DRAFT_400436 [Aspergillus ellipticus CBS 707.79]|uniref:Uncharacterized protein n=1 Tax=Aspergillus ellipticus CBS 707.79 TaxID=1448320 RepID=A0A319D537_9EURO|nr:hypothetical protein BO71DRAFT_400436 [Aspergillus ellipticus CBS 707.79]